MPAAGPDGQDAPSGGRPARQRHAPRPTFAWSWLVLALGLIALILASPGPALAQAAEGAAATAQAAGPPAPAAGPGLVSLAERALGDAAGERLSLPLQLLIIMGLLTLLPSMLLMMTAFTRIVIVLAILRQALGLTQTPPNQVLVGLALLLTFFVMAPTFAALNREAIAPYAAGQLALEPALERGARALHGFMLAQTRASDLKLFADMAGAGPFARPAEVPLSVLAPAFVTSELKTAFQIGFMLFLPFLVIDLVVASVLMSLGMMMLSPTLISLPFKLLLFVLVDGWALTMGSLAASFAGAGSVAGTVGGTLPGGLPVGGAP
jgi:flagellar biosynthetic protein FliP